VALAEHDVCVTSFLLEYFGESLESCGHCTGCSEQNSQTFERDEPWIAEAADVAVVRRLRAERHQALATPRQLARFLCGISSPATTRAKLRQRTEFGQWSHRRFADVLALAEEN
jgi:ATP-dependent DNA helicase RecQ